MQPTPGNPAAMPSALVEELSVVIDDVARLIDTAPHVALAVVRDGEPWTALCTDRTAGALNDIEQRTGGPALEALWSGHIARVTSTLSHVEWSDYVQACKHHGVGSVAAFPISIESARVGVMTVASDGYYAFGPEETRIGVQAATRAAGILSAHGARPRAHSRLCVDEPERAFESLLAAVYLAR